MQDDKKPLTSSVVDHGVYLLPSHTRSSELIPPPIIVFGNMRTRNSTLRMKTRPMRDYRTMITSTGVF
jgi:hypothetical protein